MGRHTTSGGKNHSIRQIGRDHYRIGWTVDFYYPDSMLRWPRRFTRDTDERGAARFAKRWKCKMPAAVGQQPSANKSETGETNGS